MSCVIILTWNKINRKEKLTMHISLFLGFITSVYTINDGNFLLFTDSREGEIYKMNLSTYISEPLFGFHPNPVAISFDKAKKRIYWSDNGLRQLKSGDLEGKTNRVVRYLGNDSVVDGISIDSVSRLLFFTDSGYSSISVVTLDGNNYQKKIIKEAWISQDQLFPITKL
ncbi:low-density lipoprotein receptor-related protein 4-like, partial [Saccostrea cucullata]|uniref:low-density lipoprotein receptor-related protein 4-like n=1 Tax=Saccostrea cuccullata TaxID=36930 RepID=UPI002ED40AC9